MQSKLHNEVATTDVLHKPKYFLQGIRFSHLGIQNKRRASNKLTPLWILHSNLRSPLLSFHIHQQTLHLYSPLTFLHRVSSILDATWRSGYATQVRAAMDNVDRSGQILPWTNPRRSHHMYHPPVKNQLRQGRHYWGMVPFFLLWLSLLTFVAYFYHELNLLYIATISSWPDGHNMSYPQYGDWTMHPCTGWSPLEFPSHVFYFFPRDR